MLVMSTLCTVVTWAEVRLEKTMCSAIFCRIMLMGSTLCEAAAPGICMGSRGAGGGGGGTFTGCDTAICVGAGGGGGGGGGAACTGGGAACTGGGAYAGGGGAAAPPDMNASRSCLVIRP